MRIAILNLTRLGDLVQSTPVLTGLRRKFPDAEIHLIVKSRFREVADLLGGVDRVHEIDGDALARTLAHPDVPFLEAYRAVDSIASRLADQHFDRVLNFTHSRASAALLSLMEPGDAIGYQVDREGLRVVENPWLAHMGVIVRARRLARFNLVDVYKGAAGLAGSADGLSFPVPDHARQFARDRAIGQRPSLAVQLGASQDQKTWPTDHFAATLRALFEREPRLECVLVGVAGERDQADALRALCPGIPFKDLVGETNVAELAGVLEQCHALITGDTGTMHLAGAVGTRTVSIFVGLGNPWETAVYAADHLVVASRVDCAPCAHNVTCGNPICHADLQPAWLAALIARELAGARTDDLPALPRADAFRTRFDAHGLADLEPLHPREARAHDLGAIAYREWFVSRLGLGPFCRDRVFATAEQRHGLAPADWAKSLPDGLASALDELAPLGERGARLTAALRTALPDELGTLGEQLRRVDLAAYEIARGEPLCAPLGLALEAGLEGLPAGKLGAVAELARNHYAALGRGARELRALIGGEGK